MKPVSERKSAKLYAITITGNPPVEVCEKYAVVHQDADAWALDHYGPKAVAYCCHESRYIHLPSVQGALIPPGYGAGREKPEPPKPEPMTEEQWWGFYADVDRKYKACCRRRKIPVSTSSRLAWKNGAVTDGVSSTEIDSSFYTYAAHCAAMGWL